MQKLTNPYQAPLVESELPENEASKPTVHWGIRAVAVLCFVLSSIILSYCLFVYWFLLFGGGSLGPGPIPNLMIFVLLGLITIFGMGLGAIGVGLWSARWWLARHGAVAMLASLAIYIVLAVIL